MSKLYKSFICSAVSLLIIFLFAGFALAEGNKVGTVNCEVLNLRESPDTSSKVLLKLQYGSEVTILDNSDGWYNVTYADITGWVSSKYITVNETAVASGIITGNVVNVRKNPDIESSVVDKVEKGEKVSIYGRSSDWYKIETSSGIKGWIFKDYISVRDTSVSRGGKEEVQAAESDAAGSDKGDKTTGSELVSYAKKFIGSPYVLGGSTPKGFDCSGFTKYVYAHFGMQLDRTASSQSKQGVKVEKADLQPGDLVFFACRHKYVDHVAIYIGGGKILHAESSRTGRVTTSDMEGYYNNHFVTARRISK